MRPHWAHLCSLLRLPNLVLSVLIRHHTFLRPRARMSLWAPACGTVLCFKDMVGGHTDPRLRKWYLSRLSYFPKLIIRVTLQRSSRTPSWHEDH